MHHRGKLLGRRAATSPTPSPKSWPATAPWSITTRCSAKTPNAFHVATLQAQLGRSTNFSSHSISLGGALVRNDVNVVLSEGTEATLNGLYIVNGTQHIDNHTVHRSRQAARHQPRALQGHSRRPSRAPSSTAASSSAKTRRRPTPSRPTRTWCCPTKRSSTPSPSCKFWPTTCAARTARPSASWTPNRCSTCSRAASASEEARNLLMYAFAQDIVDRIKVPDAARAAGADSFSRNSMSTLTSVIARRFRRRKNPRGFPGPQADGSRQAAGLPG